MAVAEVERRELRVRSERVVASSQAPRGATGQLSTGDRLHVRPGRTLAEMTPEELNAWAIAVWEDFTGLEASRTGKGDAAGAASGENGANMENIDD